MPSLIDALCTNNYLFEDAVLNMKHSGEEKAIVEYSSIFSQSVTLNNLKAYRKARKDKETTPIIRSELRNNEDKRELYKGRLKG